MHITHFRNLLHLYRNQVVVSVVCLFFVSTSFAQSAKGNYNYLDFQHKPYYFGITIGLNSSDYKTYLSKNYIQNDSISTVESVKGPGFNLGIVSNLKIGEYFDVRFLPTLSFAERNIAYTAVKDYRADYQNKIESVFVELPFSVRFKSAPYYDKRLFVVGGIKYVFDVASDSRGRQINKLVKIAPTDFAVEYGVGVQFFFPYFIFSPEFKISQGLNNILIYQNDLLQSQVIEKVLSRTFTISLHFEG
jgi:hypothetical protein